MREYPAKHPPEMEPEHPGEILKDTLSALKLSAAEAAAQLGAPESALRSILDGSQPISAQMAVRLGKLCGNGAAFWLRLQSTYDLWHAERDLREEVRKIPEHAMA